MASHIFTAAKNKILRGTLVLHTSDMRLALVTSATTADTEQDVEFINAFTTFGEFSTATNYTSYASGGGVLTGEATAVDDPNNRSEFDANNFTWTALGGAANETAQAMVLIAFVTAATDSTAVAYIDTGGFPFTTNGSDVTVTWNVEGVIQLT